MNRFPALTYDDRVQVTEFRPTKVNPFGYLILSRSCKIYICYFGKEQFMLGN